MLKVIFFALILNLMNLITASACTTMLVTKGTSQDGSVFVAHSDDNELFDQRLREDWLGIAYTTVTVTNHGHGRQECRTISATEDITWFWDG